MRELGSTVAKLCLLILAFAVLPGYVRAQGEFELVTGKAFDAAIPNDFYLEGNRIPTEKRDAVLLKTPAGARAVIGRINTAGYSSRIQQKYEGMLITEGSLSVGGHKLGVGSYGFGYTKPPATSNEDAKLFIYNQAGEKVAECAAKKDAEIKQPNPLQVVVGKDKTAKLYFGRYWVELK
jgi:hypothetical protein